MFKFKKYACQGIMAVAVTAFALSGFGIMAKAEFPDKPIEFIIPFGAGGSADIEGRLLADLMGKILGVSIVPVNKTGGGGAVTYSHVKNSNPDGYTVGWNSTSILTSSSIGNMDFDHSALDHLGQVEYQPMPLYVKAGSKFQSLKDFVDACKAAPGTLKIANSGAGSATHIAAIAIENAIDCEVIHLPVGIKRRNATVLSGEADAGVGPLSITNKLTRAKKLHMLAIPSSQRNDFAPDLPTMKELGYDAEIDLFRGLSVAKGTPKAIMDKLSGAMAAAAKSPTFMAFAKKSGFTVHPLSIDEFNMRLKKEGALVDGVMKKAGIYKSK